MARSNSPHNALMREANRRLHAALLGIIVDPSSNDLYEIVDDNCYMIWEWCLLHHTQPWGWCLDRYCACKIALAEHEPEGLDLGLSDRD